MKRYQVNIEVDETQLKPTYFDLTKNRKEKYFLSIIKIIKEISNYLLVANLSLIQFKLLI